MKVLAITPKPFVNPASPCVKAKLPSLSLIVAIATCWLLATSPASAQWSENFDSYTAGTGMNGQGGWTGWGNDAAAANAAKVSTTFSSSSPNSVRISGTATTPGNYCDLVHTYSGYTSGIWSFSAMQYIPSESTSGTTYFILNNAYVNGGDGTHWAGETSFNLGAGTLVDDLNQNSATPRIVRDQWVELRFDINLDANTVNMYYNGTQYSSRTWAVDAGSPVAIAAVDLYSDVSQNVYYDNISLTAVPEPGSASLLIVLGLVGGVVRKRRAMVA
jgi:PEP-CTERM motif